MGIVRAPRYTRHMPDQPSKPTEKPTAPLPNAKTLAEEQATQPVREALEEALSEVDSPEKAEEVIAGLEARSGAKTAGDVQQARPKTNSPEQAAQDVQHAKAAAPEGQKAQEVLAETAKAVTTSAGRDREVLSQTAQEVFNPAQQGETDSAAAAPRRLLREALFHRLAPLDALDAQVFLRINGLPRTRWLNQFFFFITTIFTAGAAWYGLMGLILIRDRKAGWNVIRRSALPLAVSGALVEFPIKSYFRRKRPFISIVQAIVIGKKPGTWSFPSGHSAVAFAGAWLLSRHFPRQSAIFHLVAGLVAFSRVFLGDHYPGDVITGSALGTLFAVITGRLFGPRKK